MPTNINPSNQTIDQYAIQSGGANNNLNNIVPGIAGTVLTSNGASSQATFQPIPGGSPGFVFISTQTASNSASLIFDSTMVTATYKDYLMVVSKLVASSPSASNFLLMSWSINDGSTYLNSSYDMVWNRTNMGNLSSFNEGSSTTSIPFGVSGGVGSASMNSLCGQIQLFNMNVSSTPQIYAILSGRSAAVGNIIYSHNLAGIRTVSTDVNNIRITFSGSNIASGSVSLYGVTE